MLRKFAAALLLLISSIALAAFPEKPVKIIVANPPGGPIDVLLRILSDRLSEVWGQAVVIENKPGASSILAASALAKSVPDGYTLGLTAASAVTIVPFAVEKLPYDPVRDLQSISLVARTPFVFVVAQDSPIKSWQDFVARSQKSELTMGSLSQGSAFHLVWEQTARRAQIKAIYVPSPSSSKTQMDLLGGRLDIALDAPSSARGLIESGKLRAIAITSPQRFAALPDVPTLNELGMSNYSAQPWIGLMSPIGVPADRVAVIQKAIHSVVNEPAIKAKLSTLGYSSVGSTAEELAATIRKDRQDMEPLIRQLGIRLQ